MKLDARAATFAAAAAALCSGCANHPRVTTEPPSSTPTAGAVEAQAKPAEAPRSRPLVSVVEPARTRVYASARVDIQGFGFGDAALNAENKRVLDEFLQTQARPLIPGAFIVVGHADRIGTRVQNQRLSEHRARMVSDYLVDKGLDPKVMFWEGRGAAQPLPQTRLCDRGLPRDELIACLAPDRRVTVEITGQRWVFGPTSR